MKWLRILWTWVRVPWVWLRAMLRGKQEGAPKTKEKTFNLLDFELAIRHDDWGNMPVRPKSGCRKCHGRGHTGTRKNGLHILCRCLIRAYQRLKLEGTDSAGKKSPE
jgi:hypothetical protein